MKIASVSFGYPDENNRVKLLFTHEQALAIKSLGIAIDVFDLKPDRNLFSSYTKSNFEGIDVHRFPLKAPNNKNQIGLFLKIYSVVINNRIISEIVKHKKYDLVLLNFISPIYLLFIRSFIKPNTLIGVTAHGADAMALWKNRFSFLLNKYFLRKVDLVFVVSKNTKTLVETIIDFKDHNKIIINHNGINRKKFAKVMNIGKEKIRKELNIKDSKRIILTVCDLIPRKGVDICIKADGILKNKGIDFVHIIIGRGPERNKLQEIVNELHLEKNVLFIDYIENDEDLAKYYKVCDVYTMISKTIFNPPQIEGFGISYIEAGYLGKPTVGGDSGGVPTAVKHRFTGFLVDPNNSEVEKLVAYYIKILLENEDVYMEMSKNAKKYVNDEFDWMNNAKIIKKAVESKIGQC